MGGKVLKVGGFAKVFRLFFSNDGENHRVLVLAGGKAGASLDSESNGTGVARNSLVGRGDGFSRVVSGDGVVAVGSVERRVVGPTVGSEVGASGVNSNSRVDGGDGGGSVLIDKVGAVGVVGGHSEGVATFTVGIGSDRSGGSVEGSGIGDVDGVRSGGREGNDSGDIDGHVGLGGVGVLFRGRNQEKCYQEKE